MASRCVARISYSLPSVEEQRSIWYVLNDLNGAGLTYEEIDAVVAEFHDLTGRDIKQLLKLASLWSANREQRIGPDAIRFVRRFLSTKESAPARLGEGLWRRCNVMFTMPDSSMSHPTNMTSFRAKAAVGKKWR